ncbi:Hsp20/alpha crystallin family protein [candidate division KSB1 bacterium]|nr:Hsp20/alpha crystallin family protein [candidate division KSB1 bacterium]
MAIKDLIPSWKKHDVPVQRVGLENPFQAIQREMNRLFDNFFNDTRMSPFRSNEIGTFPQINIREDDKTITVEAEVPGMDEKDIHISLSNNVLSLHGEKKQVKEDRKGQYYHMERSYGSFQRAIPLQCEVDDTKVEASFKKGVLKVVLPKTPEAQRKTKRIPITVS